MNLSYVLLVEILSEQAVEVEELDEDMINEGKILGMPYEDGTLFVWLSPTGQINTLDTGAGWPYVLDSFEQLIDELAE